MRKHTNESEHSDGSYVVKKSKKSNILAFILCVLTAFIIWAYTMSYGDGAPDAEGEQTEETA